jgi:hypothetical protein
VILPSLIRKVALPLVIASTIGGCGHSAKNEDEVNAAASLEAAGATNLVFDFKSSDDTPIPVSVINSLTIEASRQWTKWQRVMSVSGGRSMASIAVRFQAVDGLAGRSNEYEIHLGRSLSGNELSSVFQHELSHVFLARHIKEKCENAVASELYSEAFALWVSEDENRILTGSPFAFASQARDYLRDRLEPQAASRIFHQPRASQALSRLVAEARRLNPTGPQSLDGFFKTSFSTCDFEVQSVSQVLFGETQKVALSKESVLIVDGISGELLLNVGNTQSLKFPVASVFKPALVAEFPEFSRFQTSKSASSASPAWLCPDNLAGRPWTWAKAMALSCNGFFLDSERPSKEVVRKFTARLRLFGFLSPDEISVEQMIGLHPGVEASLESVVAYFSWLAIRSPEVIMELQGTAIYGTLSGLPDSNWFSRNQIALKSGTIRNSSGQPEHGWIVAIGPKTDSGRPSFFAAIHQRGSSPQILLSRFRAHLQDVLTAKPINRSAKVQILGLVPRASLTATCENQMIINGELPHDKSNAESALGLSGLSDGTKLRCDRGPLSLKYPRMGGYSERSYWGEIEISTPPDAPSKLGAPKTAPSARQARARRGSEIVLTTSERSYIAGVLASEFPSGRSETLKALALVVKFNFNNAKQLRHFGRPICDTTHCQVFGTRNRDVGAAPGEKFSKVAQEISDAQLVDPVGSKQDPWLMFSIGGVKPWSIETPATEVKKLLKLQQPVYSFKRNVEANSFEAVLGETGNGIRKLISCEKFRNMLHLPSCPDTASVNAQGETWIFEGSGEGHGVGLDLVRADRMAAEGRTSREILRTFFPALEVRRNM